MSLNKGTKASWFLHLPLFSCLVLLLGGGFVFSQDDAKTEKKDPAKPGRIEGVYEAEGAKLSIEWVNNAPRGKYVRNGQTFQFVGKPDGQGIVGKLLADEVTMKFSGKMEGDVLHVAAGFEKLKMRRMSDTVPAVQGRTKIRETLLAKSTEVIGRSVLVNADNTSVAFATPRIGQKGFHLWINGKAMRSNYDNTGMRFSPDGKRLAYRLVDGSKSFFVVDDQLQGPFDEVLVHSRIISSDSKRTIFAARTGKQWRIVVDGKQGPPFDEIAKDFGFSPDGQRVAYAGKRDGKWHAVVNAEISQPYEAILYGRIIFSPDSRHVHYAIVKGSKQIPILDGKELGSFEAVANVCFNSKNNQFAFVALEGSSRLVMAGGVEVGRYGGVGQLRFSPDGNKFAYAGRVERKWRLIVNGEMLGDPYDMMSTPVFSSKAGRIGVLGATKAEQFVVVDGKSSPAFEEVDSIVFSPDEKRVGFLARQGNQWFVIVDSKRSYPFASKPTSLTFSPNSEHFAYAGIRDGNTYLVVDGVEGKAVWPTLPGSKIVWDGAKRFHTIVRRADEFLRLDVEILK